MPADTLARFGRWSGLGQAALIARLNVAANELHVTASALKWRLAALVALTAAAARAVPDAALRHNGPRRSGERAAGPVLETVHGGPRACCRGGSRLGAPGRDTARAERRRSIGSVRGARHRETGRLMRRHGSASRHRVGVCIPAIVITRSGVKVISDSGQSCAGIGTQTATKCLRDHPTMRSPGAARIPEKRVATITCMLGSREGTAYRYEHRDSAQRTSFPRSNRRQRAARVVSGAVGQEKGGPRGYSTIDQGTGPGPSRRRHTREWCLC